MTKRLTYRMWVWIAGCAALLGSLLVGWYFYSQGSAANAFGNGILVAQVILSLAAIPLFVRARYRFRMQFRRVYILLGVGIGLLGLAQLQTPLIVLTGTMFLVDTGLIGVPFITATILIFLSMRQFANALHLKTHWTSLSRVGLVAMIVAAAGGLVPFIPGAIGDTYSAAMAFSAWNATLAFLASRLVAHISRTVSGIYAPALDRLRVALALLAFSSLQYVCIGAFLPLDSWVFTYGLVSVAFVVTGGLFLWAGLAFNFIGEASAEAAEADRVTSLNIITYVASLASDQNAIDEILDGVRRISATLRPGEMPDQSMQHELVAIYLQLEEYLVNQESLQHFTVTSLRERVEGTLGLGGTNDQTTFWPLITGKAFVEQAETTPPA